MPKSRKDAKPVAKRPSKPPAPPSSRTLPRRSARRTRAGLDPDVASEYLETTIQAETAANSDETRIDEEDRDSASVTQQLIYRQLDTRPVQASSTRTSATSPGAARTRKRGGKVPKA